MALFPLDSLIHSCHIALVGPVGTCPPAASMMHMERPLGVTNVVTSTLALNAEWGGMWSGRQAQKAQLHSSVVSSIECTCTCELTSNQTRPVSTTEHKQQVQSINTQQQHTSRASCQACQDCTLNPPCSNSVLLLGGIKPWRQHCKP